MATSGFIGFRVEGTDKVSYINSDAYPSANGIAILQWLTAIDNLDAAIDQARRLRLIDGRTAPTANEIAVLKQFGTIRTDDDPIEQWYWLLRETQGRPEQILAAGVIEDAADMLTDHWSWHWGYRIDFDAHRFEVHRRGLREPVAIWRLDELPNEAAFLAAFDDDPAA